MSEIPADQKENLQKVAQMDNEVIWKKISGPLDEETRIQWESDIKGKLPFPDENAEFDQWGLRLPVETLNQIGGGIIMLHIDMMQNYVDAVIKDLTDRQDASIYEQVKDFIPDEEHFRQVSATALGNIAYISNNFKSNKVKKTARAFLRGYLDFYLGLIQQHAAELAKQNGSN